MSNYTICICVIDGRKSLNCKEQLKVLDPLMCAKKRKHTFFSLISKLLPYSICKMANTNYMHHNPEYLA